MALARHVTFVHQHGANPDLDFTPLDPAFIKHYIAQARTVEPYVPAELTGFIVEAYVSLRAQDAETPRDQMVMTARQLLSILRLSQALARLKFYEAVTSEEVEEAMRLTHISKASLLEDSKDAGAAPVEDLTSRIYGIVRDLAASSSSDTVDYQAVEARTVKRGFSAEQLEAMLEEYTSLGLLFVNATRTTITFTTE
jgi:DNA replication licensing factor MCM7